MGPAGVEGYLRGCILTGHGDWTAMRARRERKQRDALECHDDVALRREGVGLFTVGGEVVVAPKDLWLDGADGEGRGAGGVVRRMGR